MPRWKPSRALHTFVVIDAKPARSVAALGRASWFAVAAIGSGAIFVLIALAYRVGVMSALDNATYTLFATIEDSILDVIAQLDDDFGRVIPTFAAAALMAAVLAWKGPRWAWIVPLGIGLTALVEFFAKLGLGRALHLGEILAAAREFVGFRFSTGASFPSGHVARTVFLATVATGLFPFWVALPLVGLATLTFLARLYIEAHRLSDVLGGAALGVSVACAALWLRAVLDSRSAARAPRLAAVEAEP